MSMSTGWPYNFSLYLCVVCVLYVSIQLIWLLGSFKTHFPEAKWFSWIRVIHTKCHWALLLFLLIYHNFKYYCFNLYAKDFMKLCNISYFFVPHFSGTKIQNTLKAVQESGRDAKLGEYEEPHLLSDVLLLSYLLHNICYFSDVPGLLDFYSLYQQYWGGVWCLHICRHIVEFDSHSMHALVLTLTYLELNDSAALQYLKR